MEGAYRPLTLVQESTTALSWTWYTGAVGSTPVDLTGYTAICEGRRRPGATGNAWFSLTGGAGITLGGAAGTIAVTWTDEITDTLAAGEGEWELVVISGAGARYRLLYGPLKVLPKVAA